MAIGDIIRDIKMYFSLASGPSEEEETYLKKHNPRIVRLTKDPDEYRWFLVYIGMIGLTQYLYEGHLYNLKVPNWSYWMRFSGFLALNIVMSKDISVYMTSSHH